VPGGAAGLVYNETWLASTLGEPGSPGFDLRLARARRTSAARVEKDRSEPLMSPAVVTRDQPHRFTADTVAGDRPAAGPGRFAARQSIQEQFWLRCADAHPVRCDVELVSPSRDDVVLRVCSHGASAHGFTPAWYSRGRLAAIAARVA